MLNKQLLTVAVVSILCCAAVQVDGAKPAKGGGGNHIQRGIQLAQENILTPLLTNSARRSKTIRAMRADTQIAARLSPRSANCPRGGRFRGSLHQVSISIGGFCKIHRAGAKGCLRVRGTRSDLIRT